MKTNVLLLLCCLAVQIQAEHNEKVWMGNLSTLGYSVAGKVYAIANDRYLIEDFSYDGLGPTVYLYYDSETSMPNASGKEAKFWEVVDGVPIEDPQDTFQEGGRNYSNAQLVVKLLPGDSVCTVKWISVWCKAYAFDFGNAVFSCEKKADAAATFCSMCPTVTSNMTVAPPTPTPTPTPGPGMPINCETLTNKYAMCWKNNGNSTSFTLCNANIAAGQYMGFGFSKLETPSKMIGSDVTICSFQQNSFSVRDYFLESKMVCKQKRGRQARGVCPDTGFRGSDQLSNKAIGMQDGTAWCSFTRSITSSDSPYDRNITNPQPIVWAMGPLKYKRVLKHTKRNNGPAQTIDFSSGGGTQQDGKKCDMVSHCQDMLAIQ